MGTSYRPAFDEAPILAPGLWRLVASMVNEVGASRTLRDRYYEQNILYTFAAPGARWGCGEVAKEKYKFRRYQAMASRRETRLMN